MRVSSFIFLFASSFGVMIAAAVVDQELLQGIPDSGLDTSLWTTGKIPPLKDMVAINDYQIAAKNYLQKKDYVYYRTASLGETTYINNMEIWDKVVLNKFSFNQKPVSRLDSTVLGYNFSAPFFIAPAAQAGRANSGAEANLVRAAGDAGILYVPSISSTLSIEQIDAAASQGQIMFHQQYMWDDKTRLRNELRRIKAAGYKAVFVTIDNLGISGLRDRNERLTSSSESAHRGAFTMEALKELRTMTDLPIVPKGLTSALDVKMCADLGLKAVYVSNHGGRQVDNMPTAVEILLDLHKQYPEVFGQLEIYADGGIRHGTHVLMLLALGVRAVGIARPFMFANIYGREGIAKAISKFRLEMETSMRNLGQEVLNNWFGNSTLINTKKIETEFLGLPLERSGTTKLFKLTKPL